MPMREFECSKCGIFESYVSLTIPVTRLCPQCGKRCKMIEISVPAKRNPRYGLQT